MYIKYLLFLKFSSLAITLLVNGNNINKEIALPYASHNSIIYHAIPKRATEQSSNRSRIDFQIRNHQGLGTYIFGFDTGSGKNRQFKVEERLQNGNIRGRYGFYNAKGQLKIITYVAGPIDGYQERHHEIITYKPEI